MPPVALRQSKDAKPRAAAFVPASARMARATNSNATAFFPPSEAADDVVAVCTAPSFALDMIGEEREVLLDLTLLWRLGAVPGDVVTSRLLVDGVQSTLKLVWTWPKDYCRVDSFIYLVVDDKMGPEIPFLYHRGCRREQNEEKTLLIILSKLDSTSMSMESQCAGWPVAVSESRGGGAGGRGTGGFSFRASLLSIGHWCKQKQHRPLQSSDVCVLLAC